MIDENAIRARYDVIGIVDEDRRLVALHQPIGDQGVGNIGAGQDGNGGGAEPASIALPDDDGGQAKLDLVAVQETAMTVKAVATGVSTRIAAGAAITHGFGSNTEGFWPVARSSVAGFHAQMPESSSDSCKFTPPSGASAQPVTRAGNGVRRSRATVTPSRGRRRSSLLA